MPNLICGKCGKEPNDPVGAAFCECPHCGAITDYNMARALAARLPVDPPPFCICRYCRKEVSCGTHHTTKAIPGVGKSIHCTNCLRLTDFEEAKRLGAEQIAYYEKACQAQSDEMPYPHQAEAGVAVTDCRSEEGITVGLIDTIINCARLLKGRPVTPAVEQAIKDLNADEDVAAIMVMRTPE